MKGKSQAILEFLFSNRNAYTKDEITKELKLEGEKEKVRKTIYDMTNKRNFIILVGTDKYRITPKGCNHAVISYGMIDKDIIKQSPAKKLIGVDITAPEFVMGDSGVLSEKPDIVISDIREIHIDETQGMSKKYDVDVKNSLKDLEKALKYKPSNKVEIVDLDQKLEVLNVISMMVDSKLSYWVDEVIKDLKR